MITDQSTRPGKPERTPNDDLLQIIHALGRQERTLEEFADKLAAQRDYSAEFPAADAEAMRQAIAIIRQQIRPDQVTPADPADVVLRKLDDLILWLEIGTLGVSVRSLSLADFKVLRELATPEAKPAEKVAPVQGWPAGIPWSLHLEAYAAYCKKWSPQPALIEGWCRGGFSTGELDGFIPGWRDRVSEITKLKTEIAALRAEKKQATGWGSPGPIADGG